MSEPVDPLLTAPPGNWARTRRNFCRPADRPELLLGLPLVRIYPQSGYCTVQFLGPYSRPDRWSQRPLLQILTGTRSGSKLGVP